MFTIKHAVTGLTLSGLMYGSASAATSLIGVDPRNTIPGTVAIGILADGEGIDWTGGVLRIDLTSGSIHNGARQQPATECLLGRARVRDTRMGHLVRRAR
ncbi:MAG: hypothetical protein R3C45_21385 [Phycisphaerales bacterium]